MGYVRIVRFLGVAWFVVFWCAASKIALANDLDKAVELSRKFLESENVHERQKLAAKLAKHDGDIELVLKKLQSRSYELARAGYRPEQHFSLPELLDKHPKDLLYFMIPDSYRRDRPTGLIVFLHGGGNSSSRRAPRLFMNFPDGESSNQIGDVFASSGMIAVGPSAPWNENSSYRWCLPEADDYLADVITECKARFNIDPDRVFLVGHSMGGFGAYHHILRQPDRFAAVLVSAGSWRLAHWPSIRGTPIGIVHGINDARKGTRAHSTDIEYARHTHRLLDEYDLMHTYFEHDGQHAVRHGRKFIAEFLKAAKEVPRDPYHPHIALISPVGFRESFSYPVKHNRWLTLDAQIEGKVVYDALQPNGNSDFDRWRLRHYKRELPGASIEAKNHGDNTIEITTQNVATFTVWLHPKMVDFAKPVRIVVDGQEQFSGRVTPSLVTALESYERRRDWGLIYTAKITLTPATIKGISALPRGS